jgi:hypothetical protein
MKGGGRGGRNRLAGANLEGGHEVKGARHTVNSGMSWFRRRCIGSCVMSILVLAAREQ